MKIADLSKGVVLAGRFRLLDIIGSGSYGTVWLADVISESALPRRIALKVYHNQESATRKLMGEAIQAGVFDHQRLVKVYGADRLEGLAVMWMEYVPGQSLIDYLGDEERPLPLSLDQILMWLHDIAEGLAYLHVQDPPCVHGDLKLDNVLIDPNLRVRLTDFGQSRTIQDRFVSTAGVGGMPYLAPEVLGVTTEGKGKRFVTSDIYAFGVCAYRILTGRFPRATAPEIFNQVPFPRPRDLNHSIPRELDDLVIKCLEKRESNRFRTGSELLAALEAVCESLATAKKEPIATLASASAPGRSLVDEIAQMATDLMNQGATEEAMNRLSKAMERLSTAPRIMVLYAEAARKLNKLDTAKAVYRKVLHWLNENSRPDIEKIEAYEGLAEVLTLLKQYEGAVEAFTWLADRYPEKRWYRYRLGVALGLASRYEKSLGILVSLYAEAPSATVCSKIGLAHYQKRDLNQARQYFNEALMMDQYEPTALYYLGEISAIQQQNKRAEEYLRRLQSVEGAEEEARRLARSLHGD